MERALETKAVKQALIKAGFAGISVRHGTGTAWGWLEIGVNKRDGNYDRTDSECVRIAQAITGRHGDYDGNILVNIALD